RNDVHFGMVDSAVIFYEDYHARVTFRVIAQKVEVSPEVAEEALRLVQANGAVSKTQCANTVSRILRDLGGFDEVPRTMWPLSVMEGFGKIPGVESRTIYDDSTDDNKGLLRQTEI
ncbi:MAG: hypothetical protein ABJQ14_09585, partial [Hyphomicrobiales bacterium]